MTSTDDVIAAIKNLGYDAYGMHAPTEIAVPVPEIGGYVLITRGHNRDGWEAVFEVDQVQEPLDDGPGPNAPAYLVAQWVARIAVDAVEPQL